MMDAATPSRPTGRLSGTQRRRHLLECALVVFARDGIGRAGHTQIAAVAGVSVPTVFKYFPTRGALVDAVLDQVEHRLLELARESHRGAQSARDAIRAHGCGWNQLALDEPDVVKIWLEWSASIREDVWPRFLALEGKLNQIIARTINRDPDAPKNLTPLEAARAIHGVAYMVAHMNFAPEPTGDDPETFALNVVDALLGFRDYE
jgi:TetR/AcrR family hemagglutinin/protease transcriptional regulator